VTDCHAPARRRTGLTGRVLAMEGKSSCQTNGSFNRTMQVVLRYPVRLPLCHPRQHVYKQPSGLHRSSTVIGMQPSPLREPGKELEGAAHLWLRSHRCVPHRGWRPPRVATSPLPQHTPT
jgi:hypothetical protein